MTPLERRPGAVARIGKKPDRQKARSASFGNGRTIEDASIGSGGLVAINGPSIGELDVPEGYVSGPGGDGPNQNFTLDITAAAVPEPSALALLALPLGFAMLLAGQRRRISRTA